MFMRYCLNHISFNKNTVNLIKAQNGLSCTCFDFSKKASLICSLVESTFTPSISWQVAMSLNLLKKKLKLQNHASISKN